MRVTRTVATASSPHVAEQVVPEVLLRLGVRGRLAA